LEDIEMKHKDYKIKMAVEELYAVKVDNDVDHSVTIYFGYPHRKVSTTLAVMQIGWQI